MKDPDRWQPLALDKQEAQNGVPSRARSRRAVTPFWGHVDIVRAAAVGGRPPVTPGAPPAPGGCRAGRRRLQDAKPRGRDIIETSSELGDRWTDDGDISPGAHGQQRPRHQQRRRYSINPVTGEPTPRSGADGDFAGPCPSSGRTDQVGDAAGTLEHGRQPGRRHSRLRPADRVTGRGRSPGVGRQDLLRAQRCAPRRGHRRLGRQGLLRQRAADLDDPVHGRPGPVEPPEACPPTTRWPAARAGPDRARHHGPAPRVSVTRRSRTAWARSPSRRGRATPRTPRPRRRRWLDPGRGWVPYKQPTFVTPAFPGFVSGHSTFSRAAAEVLTAVTGSAFFPGGLGEFVVPKAAARASSSDRPRRCRSSGPPTTTRPTRPACPGYTAGSTSPPMTSAAARPAPLRQDGLGAGAQYFEGTARRLNRAMTRNWPRPGDAASSVAA